MSAFVGADRVDARVGVARAVDLRPVAREVAAQRPAEVGRDVRVDRVDAGVDDPDRTPLRRPLLGGVGRGVARSAACPTAAPRADRLPCSCPCPLLSLPLPLPLPFDASEARPLAPTAFWRFTAAAGTEPMGVLRATPATSDLVNTALSNEPASAVAVTRPIARLTRLTVPPAASTEAIVASADAASLASTMKVPCVAVA